MPVTYQLASQATLDLLEQVREKYHPDLDEYDVRIGVLMAFAAIDEDSGERKGNAIKGYAGAAAAAQVKIVSLRDRLTKRYDVELLIDGDTWPETPLETQVALLDHELTHILPTGERDDLSRPKIKLRDEDFICWGFFEVVRRHGPAAIEARSVKNLIESHGQLLLEGIDKDGTKIETVANRFIDTLKKAVGPGGKATISSGDQSVTVEG